MLERKIGCLPVAGPEARLLGLVTNADLLAAAYLADEAEPRRMIDVSTTKAEFSEWMERELNDLRRVRDELRVQGHLGKAELRDRWDALERGFETLEARAKRSARLAEAPLHELEADVRKLAHDLREGYRRIRDSF